MLEIIEIMKKAPIKKLKKIFSRISEKYGIVYSILFGSFSQGYEWKESDLDIAVKLKESLPFKKKLRLISEISGEIERETGIETDVIILNDAPLGLKFEIFKNGKTIYSKSNEIIEDKSRVMGEYLDFSIWARPLFKKLMKV